MKVVWKKINIIMVLVLMSVTLLSACGGETSTSGTNATSQTSGDTSQGTNSPQITLKLGHYFTTEDFRGKTSQYWADLVQEKSGGSIKIEVYPNEQLVKGKEGFQSTAQGTIDIYVVYPSYMSGQFPLIDIFNMPLPPKEYTDDIMVEFAKEAKPLLDEEFAKHNIYNLGVITTSGPAELFFAKPIHVLEEMSGKKVRGAGGFLDEALVNLGSSVTFMSAAEQYLALQTGTVDGVSTTYSSYVSNKLYEVAPYWLNATMARSPYFIIMNKGKWDSLTTDQQQLLIEATEETLEWSINTYQEEEKALVQEMREKAKEVYELPQDEWVRWFEKVAPIYEKYVSTTGEKGQQLMDVYNKYVQIPNN